MFYPNKRCSTSMQHQFFPMIPWFQKPMLPKNSLILMSWMFEQSATSPICIFASSYSTALFVIRAFLKNPFKIALLFIKLTVEPGSQKVLNYCLSKLIWLIFREVLLVSKADGFFQTGEGLRIITASSKGSLYFRSFTSSFGCKTF